MPSYCGNCRHCHDEDTGVCGWCHCPINTIKQDRYKKLDDEDRKTFKIEKVKWITRQMVRNNPDKLFLFGDNTRRKGLGGQAKEMRGEDNTYGIFTKWMPSMNKAAFFTDADYEVITKALDQQFREIRRKKYLTIVIPADGIGTGLARLDKTSPSIFKYLQEKLEELGDA